MARGEFRPQQLLFEAVMAGRPEANAAHVGAMHQMTAVLAALQQHEFVLWAQLRQRLGKMDGIFADAPARVVGDAGVDPDAHRGRSLVLHPKK